MAAEALEGRREGGEWEHVTSLLRENLHVGDASTEPPTARQAVGAVIGQTAETAVSSRPTLLHAPAQAGRE